MCTAVVSGTRHTSRVSPISARLRTSAFWFGGDPFLLPRLRQGFGEAGLVAMAALAIVTSLIMLTVRVVEAPALQTETAAFQVAVEGYLELRHRLEGSIPAPRVTADPAEIQSRERALGVAMQAARLHARQGEMFGGAASVDVRRIIAADLMRRSASDRALIMSEVPAAFPRVNEPYPATLPLATVPALLLGALPALPADLEYRFLGSHLIIRDTKTNLIVDFLPEVLASPRAEPPDSHG